MLIKLKDMPKVTESRAKTMKFGFQCEGQIFIFL